MARIASLLIVFWAGSLWTICGLVAPTLFAVLEDRSLAGRLAAHFFRAEAWIGVAIGTLLITLKMTGQMELRNPLLVLIAAGLPLISQSVLGPLMDQARAVGDMSQFGLLHTAAAACFLGASVAMLVLVWRINQPAR